MTTNTSPPARDLPPLECGPGSACCHEIVALDPEHGHEPGTCRTERAGDVHILQRKRDGGCVYLERGHCSICPRRPAMVSSCTRRQVRAGLQRSLLTRSVIQAGRTRLRAARAAANRAGPPGTTMASAE